MGGPRKIETFEEENLHFDDSPKYGDDLCIFFFMMVDGLGFANRNIGKDFIARWVKATLQFECSCSSHNKFD